MHYLGWPGILPVDGSYQLCTYVLEQKLGGGAKRLSLQLFPCAVCCRTSSGSLWCLSNSHFSELQAVFGKVQALSRSNGYGFSSTGTPQEVNSVCVIQTPQFLLAHHLVFRVIVLIPAETQYGPVKKINKQHKPTMHTQKPMQLLSSRPWGQHPWGTLAHFLK